MGVRALFTTRPYSWIPPDVALAQRLLARHVISAPGCYIYFGWYIHVVVYILTWSTLPTIDEQVDNEYMEDAPSAHNERSVKLAFYV
jgi:hypothetical protein